MKKREKELIIPESRLIIKVEHPEKGAHYFKIPRLAKAAELIGVISGDEFRSIKESSSVQSLYSSLGSVYDKMCWVLAQVWFHPLLEIEGANQEEIADEFHMAGYDSNTIFSIYNVVFQEISGYLLPVSDAASKEREEEVKESQKKAPRRRGSKVSSGS